MTTRRAPSSAPSREGRAVPAPSSIVARFVTSKSIRGGPRGLFSEGGVVWGGSFSLWESRVPASRNSARRSDEFHR